MSRAYEINVSGNISAKWTNKLGAGQVDIGAQQIEFEITASSFDAPMGQSWVRIWGPTKQQISQVSDFNQANITVSAGMVNGLPLATAVAPQYGIIAKGQIYPAFSNWQGIVQTLDFIVLTDGGASQDQPANLTLPWKNGQALSGVLQQTLQTAYPQFKININISDKIVPSRDMDTVCQTIQQLADYVNSTSKDIVGGNYIGVKITKDDKSDTINVFDNTTSGSTQTININEPELIGSVTWLNAVSIQFNCVLRGDLSVGTLIKLPEIAGVQAISTANSQANVRNAAAFKGTWTVQLLRHIGNSREPSAAAWITTVQAFSNTEAPTANSYSDTSG